VDPRASLWRQRDFRLLWIGETTSTVGTNISRVALPLVAVVTVQASTVQVGALTAATWLPWLVVGLPAGAWVDRLPRRLVMLVVTTTTDAGIVHPMQRQWQEARSVQVHDLRWG